MNTFYAFTHCIKATRNRFVILHSLNMVFGVFWSLYLVMQLTGFIQQSQGTDTMLTSLKNLVIDNSRSTVTFNSTMLRKLFASSANRPGMENNNHGSLLFFMYRHAMTGVLSMSVLLILFRRGSRKFFQGGPTLSKIDSV